MARPVRRPTVTHQIRLLTGGEEIRLLRQTNICGPGTSTKSAARLARGPQSDSAETLNGFSHLWRRGMLGKCEIVSPKRKPKYHKQQPQRPTMYQQWSVGRLDSAKDRCRIKWSATDAALLKAGGAGYLTVGAPVRAAESTILQPL